MLCDSFCQKEKFPQNMFHASNIAQLGSLPKKNIKCFQTTDDQFSEIDCAGIFQKYNFTTLVAFKGINPNLLTFY